MVFGNRGATIGTGVVFTRDPATGEPVLYGDVLFDAQGEDVVAGTHQTEPIAALDERLPAVATELRAHAARLERHYADMCDIEFTIEDGTLWMLQIARRQAQPGRRRSGSRWTWPTTRRSRCRAPRPSNASATCSRSATHDLDRAEPPRPPAGDRPAGVTGRRQRPDRGDARRGAGRCGGGPARDPGPRRDVTRRRPRDGGRGRDPDLARRAGQSRGRRGPRLGYPGGRRRGRDGGPRRSRRRRRHVPRCRPDASRSMAAPARSSRATIPGSVEVVPEARIAARLGRRTRDPDRRRSTVEPRLSSRLPTPPRRHGRSPPDRCLQVDRDQGLRHGRKASRTLSWACPTRSGRSSTRLAIDGLTVPAAGAHRLDRSRHDPGDRLLDAERTAWGPRRPPRPSTRSSSSTTGSRTIVTAWQLRDDRDGQELNDHTDAAYDAAVIDRLAALHADAIAWLATTASGPARLADYGVRLDRAIGRRPGR